MSHKDVLKQLFPVEMGGVFDGDLAVEGDSLDQAEGWVNAFLLEMFGQSASQTIADWESQYGIVPTAGEVLQARQAAVLGAIRARGGLSIPYFTNLAAAFGYKILIEELPPNSSDPDVPAGSGAASIFLWRIHPVSGPTYYFRAGRSRAGERLVTGTLMTAMEGLFQKLKPAHTMLIFKSS